MAETRIPLPVEPGQPERVDYEYQRCGTAHRFLTGEPLAGRRHVTVTERGTAVDFAREVGDLLEVRDPHAEKVVLVMDNLNTHQPAARYEAFEPAVALALIERLEIHHTPKHGSGLNVAEIELGARLAREWLAVMSAERCWHPALFSPFFVGIGPDWSPAAELRACRWTLRSQGSHASAPASIRAEGSAEQCPSTGSGRTASG